MNGWIEGGLALQHDPGQQESLVAPLIAKEVQIAISCLAERGTLVVKMFTLFRDETIGIVVKLMEHFRHVEIFKPQCSKPSNSEVYAVCMEFSKEPIPLPSDCAQVGTANTVWWQHPGMHSSIF
jgi:hypothetical protein